MTLIELLVVISIMMLLVVVAVPRMRPAMESRRIREAARAINVFLSHARSRAIESGRPCGVAVVRDGSMALAGVRLIQVEVPEPYTGDTSDTYLNLAWTGTVDAQGYATVIANRASGSLSGGLLRIGDQIEINYRLPRYTIIAANSVDAQTGYIMDSPPVAPNQDGFPLTLRVYLGRDASGNPVTPLPWPPGGTGSPGPHAFQILRQAVTSSVAALQLPRSVAIDLWYSGTNDVWLNGNPPLPLADAMTASTLHPYPTIMFSATGSVMEIAADTLVNDPLTNTPHPSPLYSNTSADGVLLATNPVYLLVGRRDRVNPDPAQGGVAVAEDGRTNIADLENLWVAVNPQTGYIVCAENAADDPATSDPPIVDARRHAREFQSMGGR